MNNRLFFYPDYRRYVLFTANALEHMYGQVQRRIWQKEAGGEIYAFDPDAHGLIVSAATGPNKGDRRTRSSYNPDVNAAMRERERLFALDQHAVGLWHTHPEPFPSPSGPDKRTTEEYLRAFQGDRDRYLMVILGDRGNPVNMTVWATSQNTRTPWVALVENSIHPLTNCS